ncbi:MAG: nicotinate-nucleotide adenylyltransferase [Roseiflexaceae bacterium]
MTQRIGILGGTFDPIHHGHLAIAEEVRIALALDHILLIPAGYQPLKQGRHAASPHQRYQMVHLACQSNPHLIPSDIEIMRSGPSYTVDTLQALSNPERDLFFILGADAIAELPRWRQVQRVLELTQIVGVTRAGTLPDQQTLAVTIPELANRLQLVVGPRIDISSTDIRQRVANGRPIRYLTPDPVVAYIASEQLYQHANEEPA